MKTTLITFLGKVPASRGSSYQKTSYDFGNTQRESAFFGSALADEMRADVLRVLGTAGSMWDVLALELHEHTDEALEQAVKSDSVTQPILDALEIALNSNGKRHYQLRLIPYGYDEDAQVKTMESMASGFQRDDIVSIDITHGLRHLPMLGLLSAFYLQAVVRATVASVYYAAFDLAENGVTPVVKLNGLLRIYEWLRGMEQFNKDGDYGAFGPLLTREGLPGKLLTDAAYLERIKNASEARRKLDTFAANTKQPTTATGAMFLPELTKRIAWRNGRMQSEWEASLAREYLQRRDYVRAAEFAYESLVTEQVEKTGGDDNNFDLRHSADETLFEIAKREYKGGKHNEFWLLKNLRNTLAHGTRSDSSEVSALTADETRLSTWLKSAFEKLLPK